MGSVVGPEVATQLKSLTSNKVTVQGVTYSADAAVSGFKYVSNQATLTILTG
jgi:hypothetical protein